MSTQSTWIEEHKDFLVGLGIIVLVGSLVQTFKSSSDLSIFVQVPLAILAFSLLIAIVSGIFFLISWPFVKNVSLLRFIKICITVGVILDICTIITIVIIPH